MLAISHPPQSLRPQSIEHASTQTHGAVPRGSDLRFDSSSSGFAVFDADGKQVGSLDLAPGVTSPQDIARQKKLFAALYGAFKGVQDNVMRDVDSTARNAQYINALKETHHLADGRKATFSYEGGRDVVYLAKPGVDEPSRIEIPRGLSREDMIAMLRGPVERIDNNARSLGVSFRCGKSTIHIGDAQEHFSIQSISKVFADIALHLCNANAYRAKDGKTVAIFNVRPGSREAGDVARESGCARIDLAARQYRVPVEAKFSPHPFNKRENVEKRRKIASEPAGRRASKTNANSTEYAILNASNNYGALATTGRIETGFDEAIIDGVRVQGADNIVKAVMQGLLAPGEQIDVNAPVLAGELQDTLADHDAFLKSYADVYLPVKQSLMGERTANWAHLARTDAAKLRDPVQQKLKAVLEAVKAGKCGTKLQAAVTPGTTEQWMTFPMLLRRVANTDWHGFKNLLELAKLHFPDNLTRTLWLMGKGVYGDEYVKLANLQVAETEIGNRQLAPKREQVQAAFAAAKRIMQAYTTHCAFSVNCDVLATLAYPIATNGLNRDNQVVIPSSVAEDVRKQIEEGGLYDESRTLHEFPEGKPFDTTKSGVGGGLMSAETKDSMVQRVANARHLPYDQVRDAYEAQFGSGGFSAAFLSRPLNKAGNSAAGLELNHAVRHAVEEMLADSVLQG